MAVALGEEGVEDVPRDGRGRPAPLPVLDEDDAGDNGDDTDGPAQPGDLSVFKDPGTEPWQIVPEDEVAAKCKMDIAKLKGLRLGSGFAVVRYGELCYDSSGGRDTASQMFSSTKTLSPGA